jgi:large subunit ribosomal protein L35
MKAAVAKTRKAVAKRFKLTASGKIKTGKAGRRHLAASKNRKRKRNLAMPKMVDKVDEPRIKDCLPFG